MTDWQDISTAPLGVHVLLTGGEVDDSHWKSDAPPMVVGIGMTRRIYSGDILVWIACRFDSECAEVEYLDPTHWQPLPLPPPPKQEP